MGIKIASFVIYGYLKETGNARSVIPMIETRLNKLYIGVKTLKVSGQERPQSATKVTPL